MIRGFGCVALSLALLLGSNGSAQEAAPDPYAQLRSAYAARDAEAAAAAYAADGRYVEAYDGASPLIVRGRAAIAAHLRAFFAGLPPDAAVDINFRTTANAAGRVTGFYRLRIGRGPDSRDYFGRFATLADGSGRFALDVSGSATRDDFEGAPGPVMFAADNEDLDRTYYGALTGSWRRPDGCRWTVTRSVVRLFLLDECSGAWRGLNRISGREWRVGSRIVDDAAARPVRFLPDGNLSVDGEIATRERGIVQEDIGVPGPAGRLAGTLYRPADDGAIRPAMVLVHGSGPQDRDGYASIIQLMALRLARAGFVVLTYDKRGAGGSAGNGAAAGFPELAADANAAMTYLRSAAGVDPARVGIGGSSQAGWVAARSVVDGGAPAFVMLIGAAGSAVNVEEQNLYNSGVLMRCGGFSEPHVRAALTQQAAFFAARRDPSRLPELRAATARAAALANPALNEWLFPADVTPGTEPQWYDVLDTEFAPLAIWRTYRGPMLLLFGQHDDSTPTDVALQRLADIRRDGMTVTTIAGAQHIGLATDNVCRGGAGSLTGFAPGFWEAVDGWAQSIARGH